MAVVVASPYMKGGRDSARLAHRTRYFATREGVQLLNAAMAYDIDQPLDITNCPRWYVVEDCLQTIRAYNEYTCREEGTYSQRDALKDIVDPDRYFWSMLPIGEPPPRRGTTAAIWSDAARSPAALPSAERVG